MATNTIEQTAEEGLRSAISGAADFSDFKMPDVDSPVAASSSDTTLNNSTEDNNSSEESRSDSSKVATQTQTKSSREDAKASDDTNKATSNRTDKPKQTRPPQRIEQLLQEVKTLKSQLAEQKKNEPQTPAKEPEPLVTPPTKPTYSRDQLKTVIAQARANGRDDLIEAAQEEIEKIRDYEIEMAKWENKNSRAWEQHNHDMSHYENEAYKQWPDLKDPESSMSQAHAGIVDFIGKQMPEVMKKPISKFMLARIADWSLKSARVDVAEQEIKKLREEIQSLKKSGQPLNQKDNIEVGSKGSNPAADAKEQLMADIREFNKRSPMGGR